MSYPLVRELAAEGIPVRLTCGVLGFTPQAFYKWQSRPVSDRDLDDAYLTNALVDAHRDDPEFGYRFLADELEHTGHQVGIGVIVKPAALAHELVAEITEMGYRPSERDQPELQERPKDLGQSASLHPLGAVSRVQGWQSR